MSKENLKKVAEQYIKDQFKIMAKHGKAPKLNQEQYREVVTSARRSFELLRPAGKLIKA